MADDPFADYQNMLGIQGLTGQNPYLEYQGKIPMAGYYGTPTNAQGQPIQSYLDWLKANPSGTTINNTPAQPQQHPNTNQMLFNAQNEAMGIANAMGAYGPGSGQQVQSGGPGVNDAQLTQTLYQANLANAGLRPNRPYSTPWGSGVIQGNMGNSTDAQGNRIFGSGAGAQQQSTTSSYGPTPEQQRQAYLNALSNPGQVTTPSAQIYPGAAQTGAPQPSVLNQFLAAHAGGGTTGAGGYTNVPFFNTLNALKSGGSP